MKHTTGNLWTITADAKVVTTNGRFRKDGNIYRAVMGKGTALQARLRWPALEEMLGRCLQIGGNHVYLFQTASEQVVEKMGTNTILTMPVKDDWRMPADSGLIKRSATELVEIADGGGWTNILLPEPGTGAGNLDWSFVEAIIKPILDDRFTVVHLE